MYIIKVVGVQIVTRISRIDSPMSAILQIDWFILQLGRDRSRQHINKPMKY